MPTLLGHPLRVALWTAKGAALLHVVFAHRASAAPGWGPSMLPTFLVDGQWFVVDRRARRGRGVAVGDCVLYAIPVISSHSPPPPSSFSFSSSSGGRGRNHNDNNNGNNNDNNGDRVNAGGAAAGEEGVKRVMGLPGDYVLLNSPEDAPPAGAGGGAKMMQVPPGHCYITGDNLPWSRDSRDYGPLPMALIKGRVTHTAVADGWWPPRWFTRVENGLVPVVVAAGPPPPSSPSSPSPPPAAG